MPVPSVDILGITPLDVCSAFVLLSEKNKRRTQKSQLTKGDITMSATAYLKEASGLIGLFVTIYLWSLVATALQS